MEKMTVILYRNSIEELEEYKALLIENAHLCGLPGMAKEYENNPEAIVSFAILQAIDLVKGANMELKKIKGEK